LRRCLVYLLVVLVAACSTPARREAPAPATGGPSGPSAAAPPPTASSRYYKDDGPGENIPPNLDATPDAVPRVEALHRFANRPYTVLGREYVPATTLKSYHERGIASWYGRKFHGQKTSIGETYDMFGMTAAHPTLPLPSYARVTNVATGRSVVVRVNDRGPFLHDRLIDLSYAAAHKLGIAQRGSGEVEVEAILPGANAVVATTQSPLPAVASAPVVAPPAEVAPVTVAAARVPERIREAQEGAGATRTDAGVQSSLVVQPGSAVQPGASVHAAAVQPGTVQPAPTVPSAAYAVQLGAFASYANARNFLAHAQNQFATAQVEAKVRQAGGLYRVYVGPYADRDEARRVGERITQAFGFATTVAPH
jgi:rare lipoprotein A